jgi:hypothetical protein
VSHPRQFGVVDGRRDSGILYPSGVGSEGHTIMPQQIQLALFIAACAAFIVTGCILTRKPTKKPLKETLRPAAPGEHQPGCFALEEERGANWKGIGPAVPSIKEAKPSL